jgi:small subunit ribosomal protein S21
MLSERRLAVMLTRDGAGPNQGFAALTAPPRGRFRPFRRWSKGLRLQAESDGEREIVQIVVRDNNVDQALKALKKKMQREGLFREMKRRNHFEKPSERKAREKAEAVGRARKLARKRAQREGLLSKT